MVIPESRVHSDLSYTQSGRILLDALHLGSVDIFLFTEKGQGPKIDEEEKNNKCKNTNIFE